MSECDHKHEVIIASFGHLNPQMVHCWCQSCGAHRRRNGEKVEEWVRPTTEHVCHKTAPLTRERAREIVEELQKARTLEKNAQHAPQIEERRKRYKELQEKDGPNFPFGLSTEEQKEIKRMTEWSCWTDIGKMDIAAADRLIELLGPRPTRKVTRAELKDTLTDFFVRCWHMCGDDTENMNEVARRLGLEVADESRS